MFGITFRQ